MKKTALILIFVGMGILVSTASAEESYQSLRARTNMKKMGDAIKKGSNEGFSSLPAKGYRDGLSGLLRKFNVYPNPEYSFVSCGPTDVIKRSGGESGCVVSLKLARKLPGGAFHDIGIRVEYAIAENAQHFVANNSAYAQHAISGDGWLERALKD